MMMMGQQRIGNRCLLGKKGKKEERKKRGLPLTKDTTFLSGGPCQDGHTSNVARLAGEFGILQLSDVVLHRSER